jgi:hypothetical protein
MYKVNGLVRVAHPPRRRLLDFRVPEDQLATEQIEEHEIRSPKIDQMIDSYYEADHADDDQQKASLVRDLIDEVTAVNKLRGVPVYAHLPLPPQFVTGVLSKARRLSEANETERSLIDSVGPNLRAAVAQQLAIQRGSMAVRSQLSPNSLELDERRAARSSNDTDILNNWQRLSRDPGRSLLLERRNEEDADRLGESSAERLKLTDKWAPWSTPADDDPERPPFQEMSSRSRSGNSDRRIVKPYRRYATPGMGEVDTELQDADQLARNADIVIRDVSERVIGNPEIERSNNRFLREFASAMRRYYSEDGDRAVAGVKTRFDDLSIETRDRYATYDPSSDRIYFSKRFNDLSYEEKIITIIHEALHATLTMKNEAARVGYHKDRIGGSVFAHHEAYVDNVAKALAKKLGLIPQEYPETQWQSYYQR